MATTRITAEQQAQMGFSNPEDFNRALTTYENRNSNDVPETISTKSLTPTGIPKIVSQPKETDFASLEAMIPTYTQNLQQKADTSKKAVETSLEERINRLLEAPTESELTAGAYAKEGGVDDIQRELDEINQQIRQEQVRIEREVERLEQNPEGRFGGALEDQIADARTKSLRRQADLSIIQMGLQGRYDSARAIADRAVAVQLEREKNINEALKLNYEYNKELFDKDEQRAFEAAQADRERELDKREADRKSIYELAITARQNGASAGEMQRILEAENVEKALVAASSRLQDPIKVLQRVKLQKEIDAITEGIAGKITDPQKRFEAETKLAGEFDDRTKDFQKAQQQIDTIEIAFNKALTDVQQGKSINAASQGVLVSFQKLLDPTSVVRESEYARSGEGLSLLSRVEGKYEQLRIGGAGVSAEDLREFNELAQQFFNGYQDAAIEDASLIINQASAYGLNIENIIPESILGVMNDRFIEKANNTPVGGTLNIGGKTYQRVANNGDEGDFIIISQ